MKKHIKIITFILCPGLIFLLLAMPELLSSKENAPNQLAKPDIEIFLENGLYQWAEQNPYLKKLAATPAWEDLSLSGQFISLLTLGNKLEKQLQLPFTKNLLKELLESPTEISLWQVFEKYKKTNFAAVINLQPQMLSLVKLAETYSRQMKKSTEVQKGNYEMLETQWMDHTLYHLIHKNVLIVSNDPGAMDYIMSKASGNGSLLGFRDTPFYRDFLLPHKGNVKIRINLLGLLHNFKDILERQEINLAVNMDLGETVTYYPFFITADPGFTAKKMCKLTDCHHLVPREPLVAATGLYTPGYYLEMLKQLPSIQEAMAENSIDMETDLIPLFKNRFFFYITGLQTNSTDNILDGVAGFSLEKCSESQKQKILDFMHMLMTPPHKIPQKETLNKKIEIYRFPDNTAPAFCVLDKWLLLGTGYDALKESISVYTKQIPCLADNKEYRQLKSIFSKKGYCHIFLSPSRFFQSVEKHLFYLAKSATDFNGADVNRKIAPAVKVLTAMPCFGLYLDLNEKNLEGKVTFSKSINK